ncbi:right-handed parallel beta-helix repeat-containing protein [Myxococcota bacterium]|nr:right-handed parallel beta-helix repeat-containing protein [Myxococcota bacterium]
MDSIVARCFDGIVADSSDVDVLIRDSIVIDNRAGGIGVGRALISDNLVSRNGSTGVSASAGSVILGNAINNNRGAALNASVAGAGENVITGTPPSGVHDHGMQRDQRSGELLAVIPIRIVRPRARARRAVTHQGQEVVPLQELLRRLTGVASPVTDPAVLPVITFSR